MRKFWEHWYNVNYKYMNDSGVNEQKMPQQGINAWLERVQKFEKSIQYKIITWFMFLGRDVYHVLGLTLQNIIPIWLFILQ